MTDQHIISTPREFDIAITGRCNLKCAYCFYADEMTGRTDLSTEAWLSGFDKLGELGVMKVTLTGGEVFTRPDFFDLIDGVIANHMRYTLLSNGSLINEKTIEAFGIGKRKKRLNVIQISIDGSSPDIHDESRPKSFNKAIRALKLLHQAKFPITVRVTINRFNYQDLENIADLLLDEIGLRSFSTNEAFPCGATNRYEPGITLNVKQRLTVIETLEKLLDKYPEQIYATSGPLALLEQDKSIKDAISQGLLQLPGRGALKACGCIFKSMAILHDGTIVPCHILSDIHLGNILKDDIQDIWHNHPVMLAMRARRQISLDEIEPCAGCSFKGYCTGGCPGGALFFNGDLNTRNPMDCYRILIGEEAYPPSSTLEG